MSSRIILKSTEAQASRALAFGEVMQTYIASHADYGYSGTKDELLALVAQSLV